MGLEVFMRGADLLRAQEEQLAEELAGYELEPLLAGVPGAACQGSGRNRTTNPKFSKILSERVKLRYCFRFYRV